jgi:hypothetical protein
MMPPGDDSTTVDASRISLATLALTLFFFSPSYLFYFMDFDFNFDLCMPWLTLWVQITDQREKCCPEKIPHLGRRR